MNFSFRKKYFVAAVILLLLEVLIALYVQDSFIRPYGGDFLVVILLYCVLKSFLRIPVKNAIFGVLLFCWLVEGLQYIKITRLLELEDHTLITTVFGSHYEWLDLLIYSLAAVAIYIFEQVRLKQHKKTVAKL